MMKTTVGRLIHAANSLLQRILSAIEMGAWKKAERAIDDMPAVLDALKEEIKTEREKEDIAAERNNKGDAT